MYRRENVGLYPREFYLKKPTPPASKLTRSDTNEVGE